MSAAVAASETQPCSTTPTNPYHSYYFVQNSAVRLRRLRHYWTAEETSGSDGEKAHTNSANHRNPLSDTHLIA
jgi:hypothetical protein